MKQIEEAESYLARAGEILNTVLCDIKPTKIENPQTEAIQQARRLFPSILANMLNFTEKPEYVEVKPRQFLGSENFAKIATAIREAGGEYISAGRDSHFRLYKKKESN